MSYVEMSQFLNYDDVEKILQMQILCEAFVSPLLYFPYKLLFPKIQIFFKLVLVQHFDYIFTFFIKLNFWNFH